MSDVIWRLFSVQWNGLPVASLAVFVVGGVMYAAGYLDAGVLTSARRGMAIAVAALLARRRAIDRAHEAHRCGTPGAVADPRKGYG
jgi:hypothetical protein